MIKDIKRDDEERTKWIKAELIKFIVVQRNCEDKKLHIFWSKVLLN